MQEQALERAEGSLAFPFLDDEASIDAYRESRTLFIMRGLPGSGKSTLASTIAGKYEGICNVISADHKIRPEARPALPEKYQELDEEVGRCCEEGVAVVVIDDTNHQWERLEKLFDIASEYQYLAHLVEPKTPWKNDCAALEEKTQWELTQSELEDLRGSLEEAVYPLFYGWFLTQKSQSRTKETGKKLLETLGELDEFKEHWGDFGGAASEKGINLEEYFDGKEEILHCTTKFCDYGKATGAQEYAELEAVKEFYSSAFHLQISGLFITPRTAGARIRLSDKQLEVWPADLENATPSEELPCGSRAHITLGCAKDVEPVQTGLDLLEFIKMEKEGDQDWAVKDTDQGKLRYFGKGMWMLELSEEVTVKTIFGGFYPKEEGGEEAGVEKKEGEERAVEKEEGEEKTVEKEGDERAVGEKAVEKEEGDEKAVEKEGDEKAVKEGDEKAVKEGDEKAVKKEGDEKAVEKEGDEKAVEKKEGDEKAVEKKEGDEKAVEKKEGDEKAVKEEGDEKAVEKKEGDEKAVEKKEGDEKAVKEEGDEKAEKEEGDEKAVKKEGDEKAVEEKGEEKENQQEGKPAEGKKKGKCTIM